MGNDPAANPLLTETQLYAVDSDGPQVLVEATSMMQAIAAWRAWYETQEARPCPEHLPYAVRPETASLVIRAKDLMVHSHTCDAKGV